MVYSYGYKRRPYEKMYTFCLYIFHRLSTHSTADLRCFTCVRKYLSKIIYYRDFIEANIQLYSYNNCEYFWSEVQGWGVTECFEKDVL